MNVLGAGEFSNATEFSTSESGKMLTNISVIMTRHKMFQWMTCFNFTHTVPSEPRNLTVISISSTSLQITWMRPLCEYGVVTNYTVSTK